MRKFYKRIKILVVGCGNMGRSHAKAYHNLQEFEIVGLVSRGNSKIRLNEELGGKYRLYDTYEEAIQKSEPDAVCITTYPDTHEEYAIRAMENGCHVFLEKPIAINEKGAERVAEAAIETGRKLVVGYILRHHPSWMKFIDISKNLGSPLVMRMNLNQQSFGDAWRVHKNIMESLSPIVDCGVHYIDVMLQMVNSKVRSVSAIGARLSDEISPDNYNYGQLQIIFENGSIGWYEAGWGPMISENAFFIKDVFGPMGSASIIAKEASSEGKSSDVASHTSTDAILIHHSDLDSAGNFAKPDSWFDFEREISHDELCELEQMFFSNAITNNVDLTEHVHHAVLSLKIALACDESIKTGRMIYF